MLITFIRTLILYILVMGTLRLLGKRQIGQLEPSELVVTMMISDLATVPMQDLGIPLLSGIIPILTLLSLSLLFSQLSLRNLFFRSLLCGAPAILICHGSIQQNELRKNRFTLDELLEELRKQGCFRISDVKYAILENNGQLSVLPWSRYQPPSAEELGIETADTITLPTVLINDGRIVKSNLLACGKNGRWLADLLKTEHLSSPREVFLLTIDDQDQILCIKKEGKG